MVRADFLTGVVLILSSLYVIFESWRMPRMEHLGAHPLSVPGVVPAFLAAVLIIFGVVLVIRSVRAGGHRLGLSVAKATEVLAKPGNQRLLITLVLTIGYAGFLIGRIPYELATGLFVFAFIVLFEWERGLTPARYTRLFGVAAVLAVVFTGLVSWVFERLFLVTLP
ncbi:MAG TPA: tripartite tricarboxylate transporter TctB family protein [Candidatus Methylomirabilis sp.]|jgi:putative tricarboxylic transport membrane protein|nr:tripartite tricarboxylate transporter TctB family protein [Candidatus Methylomirabilis sp.]